MKYLLAKNKIYIINTKYLSPNLKNYKCKIFHIQHYSLATLILECSHYSKFVYIISVYVHICVSLCQCVHLCMCIFMYTCIPTCLYVLCVCTY